MLGVCQYTGMLALSDRPISLPNERRNTISARVYERLREAIVTAEFSPGRKIAESEIADALSVSRTPVREAFIRLFEEGLIEVSPQTGTRISLIKTERVRQAIFIRSSMECAAMRSRANPPPKKHLRELERNIEAQEEAIDSNDFKSMHAKDMQFHELLMAEAGQPLAWTACQFVCADMIRVGFLIGFEEPHLRQIVAQHRKVLDGLAAGDFEAAAQAMGEHINGAEFDRSVLNGKNNDYFDTATAER